MIALRNVLSAREVVAYRAVDTQEGFDGLDSVRHSLRVLRQSNLPDTRLIICNTKSQQIYWDIDKMLMEPEFADMIQRVVLTCNPDYFGIFTIALRYLFLSAFVLKECYGFK